MNRIFMASGRIFASVKFACAYAAAILGLVVFEGCMTPGQASRGTSNNEGDVEPTVKVCIGDNSHSNTVIVTQTITHGDGALASADSSGSTESQEQTPTFDISPKTDLRYNDAIGAGGNAVSTFVSSLTSEGMATLRDAIVNKKSGKITVARTDGTTETLDCVNGTCTTSSGLKIDSQNCASCGDPQ